jgi:hypothetical protein
MNKLMNHIQAYSNILKIRTKFKRLQQLSWTLSKLEQQYNIDNLEPNELNLLHQTYVDMVDELYLIYDELKDERTPREQGVDSTL